MLIVSCGLGTNSAGLLAGFAERGIRPDAILFGNTGGERPHTYAYRDVLNEWLRSVGMPEIVTVQNEKTTLEADCLRRRALPSIAYGFKTCSQRFKTAPQEKWMNNWPPAQDVWARGEKVTKVIGFDADEPWRAKHYEDKKFTNWYPLIEWNWGRDECVEAIARAGLPQPGKSSCFYCPNMKQTEIREQAAQYTSLTARAIAMERNADLDTIKGLGRDWAWESLLANGELFEFPDRFSAIPCECVG